MKRLSEIAYLPPSPIRKMFDMAEKMDNVINFCLGEPDFITPNNVIEVAKKSLDKGETHYTPNSGLLELKQEIVKSLEKYDGLAYDPENEIMVTGGAMEGLLLSMMALIDPGEEIILANPSYVNYKDQVHICHGIPKFVPVYEKDGFNFTIENLKCAINDKTKAILINSPSNPTGGVASEELMREIAKLAIENDLYIIFDEVYKHLIYGNEKFFNIASIDGMKERTLVLDSLSKSHAMTGWRIGYIAGPKEIVSNLPKIHECNVSCMPAFIQKGAIEALKNGDDAVRKMRVEYERRRELIYNGLNSIDGLSCVKPKGAFYIFLNITKTGLSSEEFAMRLLNEEKVAIVPGTAFGSEGDGFLRISYALSEDKIREGLKRIARFMGNLNRQR